MDLEEIINSTGLDFATHRLSKNDLKTLFIFNRPLIYTKPNEYQIPGVPIDNPTYECFRNASLHFMIRMRFELWNNIDLLNNNPVSDMDFNKYLITQTLIELMDEQIINRVIQGDVSIQVKRRRFINDRFNQLRNVENSTKYSSYGLTQYYDDKVRKCLEEFAEVHGPLHLHNERDYQFCNERGGVPDLVFNEFFIIKNYFSENNVRYLDNVNEFETLSNINQPNYIRTRIIPQLRINDFISNIGNYVTKRINGGKTYTLVGILYDCPENTAHNITSVCFDDDCLSTPPKHVFLDDEKKIVNELRNVFNQTELKHGCTIGNILVIALLYEANDVKERLNESIRTFVRGIRGQPRHHGGSAYYTKYLKYKNKYLELKRKLKK